MLLRELRDYAVTQQHHQLLLYKTLLSSRSDLQKQVADTFAERLSDLITRFPEFQQLVTQRNSLISEVSSLVSQVSQLEAQYKMLSQHKTDSDVLSEFYKQSLEDLTTCYLDDLSGTLSDVYTSVYGQDNKTVKLSMEDYRGRKVVRLNIINNYEGSLYGESLDNDGGSAMIILGSIVAIYFILATGMPRIIFFDESVSALATPTLRRYLAVLRRFCQDLDFTFVIIEHAAFRLRGYVDQVFTIKDGSYEEVPVTDIDKFLDATGKVNDE